MKRDEKERRRIIRMIARMKAYVDKYADCLEPLTEDTFVKDMLYGIGVAIGPQRFQCADGFKRFQKTVLSKQIADQWPSPVKQGKLRLSGPPPGYVKPTGGDGYEKREYAAVNGYWNDVRWHQVACLRNNGENEEANRLRDKITADWGVD